MKFITSILLLAIMMECPGQDLVPSYGAPLNDGSPITLGMVFRPSQATTVAGVKYYRSWQDGAVTGQLWSSSGTLLAQGTFASSSAGWQSLIFSSPVPVAAGQEYVVSYFSASGSYSSGSMAWPKAVATYTAVRSVFRYGSSVAFPSQSYQGSIYGAEPILVQTPPPSQVIRDTVWLSRDTCGGGFKEFIDQGGSMALMLPEEGGYFVLPDSTTYYQALFGAAPPHLRLKDDASLRVHRFTHSFSVSGKTVRYRFTLYKTGAWIREQQQADGSWKIIPYPKP